MFVCVCVCVWKRWGVELGRGCSYSNTMDFISQKLFLILKFIVD